jgi:hypothetical protein
VTQESFRATLRYFHPEEGKGLVVADVPADVAATLGGLKQQRVSATLNGSPFDSNVMPAGGGRLALSVRKGVLDAARLAVGDEAEFSVRRLDPASAKG